MLSDNRGSMFAFVKGVLTEAVERGEWVLLDEVNLADADALMAVGALIGDRGAMRLPDGHGTVIKKHPEFR